MASTFAPLGSPPPGVIPNFNNPTDTLYPDIVAAVTVTIVLTTSFTAARLVAKKSMSSFTLEDYFSLATWVMFVGYATTFMLQGNAGIGRHIWEIDAAKAPEISKISWAIELMYCIITWLAKAGLLLQMQRIFSPARTGAVYIACQILIWSNLAFYTGSFFALVFECVPQQRIWNPLITTGHCIKTGELLIAMGIINVVSDLMILILPMWAIFHLNMGLKWKLGISAVFATGLLAFVCSICRLAYTIPPLHSTDTSYLFAPVGLWSLAEITSIILCTCLPLMPRFWKVIRGQRGKNTYIPQQTHYLQYNNSNRNYTTITSNGKCLKCKHKSLCALHRAESKAQSITQVDEERFYIHKTVSFEMESRQ